MTATIAQTVGVDISKLTLDVYLHPQATARQFPNTACGIKALLAWLGQTSIHRVIFEPTGAYHRVLLISIPAIGEATALTMLIEMPELGAMENKCVASLAGLAPIARDSGQHSGKRFIRAGRAHLRQALYMPALVAIRFNADMKAKYQALLAAGKPPKVAITAVMRKLAILANALLREHRNWTPKTA